MTSSVAAKTMESDRAWLDGYRRGERDALERVYDTYVQDVARTLRAGVIVQVDGQPVRVGKGLYEHELESLVHDTFARAFGDTARQGYDGLRPFGAYLATIARNLLVDRGRRLRREDRAHAFGLDVNVVADEDATVDIEQQVEEKELSALVTGFAATLEEPEKSIFELRYAAQKSHRETAQSLGMSEVQIRRRDSRLRVRLLEHLRKHGFLQDARVSIGTSLLGRKARVEAE